MKNLLLAAVFLAVLHATLQAPTQKDLVDHINALDIGWTAKVYDEKFHLGSLGLSNDTKDVTVVDNSENTFGIPDTFDSRSKWPQCIHQIRNQANCGSCWAFGATESLADRLCIASTGQINVVLSAQQLVACDTKNFGCKGGYLINAWEYMATEGVVTEDCYPYNIPDATVCRISHSSTTCPSGYGTPVFYYAANYYKVASNVAAIQTEIMTNGPVEASFTVYQDFMSYRSGVYYHISGAAVGGHAIKILGWGTENSMPYWLCANSWGAGWGLDGFFKIYRGINECGIESNAVTGLAKVHA